MIPLIIPAYIAARAIYVAYNRPKVAPNLKVDPSPVIAFVGAASAGKSSLGNRLTGHPNFAVGMAHGTTTTTRDVPYCSGHVVRDTPGLLDKGSPPVLSMIRDAFVVVYVSSKQLYRPELDALATVARWHETQNSLCSKKRHLLVFCNKQDERVGCMSRQDVAKVRQELLAQTAPWVKPEHVLHGSASTDNDAGVIRLSNLLKTLIAH